MKELLTVRKEYQEPMEGDLECYMLSHKVLGD